MLAGEAFLMERVLGRFSPYAFAVLRIVAGLLFAFHGAQKLFGVFGGRQMPLMSQMGLAGAIELVCGLLIAIGLFTSIAAIIASGEMAAAYYQAHLPRGPVPIQNGGELALLYCFFFLYTATRGPGPLSVGGNRGRL
jgi:putative oxidoreductase